VTVDWGAVERSWVEYLEYPSSENARKVYILLPNSGHVRYTDDKVENGALEVLADPLGLEVLKRQILSGDRNAVKVAFRLCTLADGAFAEQLDWILASLVRVNPHLFLEELQSHWDLLQSLGGGLPLGALGPEFVDRLEARRLEVTLQIKALGEVHDRDVVSVRDKCIGALRRWLEDHEP
jgi:hypothetical protein